MISDIFHYEYVQEKWLTSRLSQISVRNEIVSVQMVRFWVVYKRYLIVYKEYNE